MRITLFAFGSRGDVQPHIALGAGLRAAGHSVRVVTHALFEPLVTRLGLDFSALEVNPQSVVENERGQDWLGSGANFLQFFQRFSRIAEPVIQQTMRDCWQACQGTDLVVFSPLGIGIVSSIAEKLGVPYWIGAGQPLTPTGDCAIPFFPQFPQVPGWLTFGSNAYHRSTYLWSARLYWRLLLPSINKARRDILNLSPMNNRWLYEEMKQQRIPMLYYFSPSVLPRPADWNEHNLVTGYWYLDDAHSHWQPPAELVRFLAAGPPPVYVGFGSMHTRRSAMLSETVINALVRTKQRGILATGWSGINMADLPDSIFPLDYVPHDWLFPQMAAVIHHGGAGTMAATVRAGIPAVLIPFFGDQPFWGRRYCELGVIPPPILQKRLTVDRLARAINVAINDESMHKRMLMLSAQIREEHGVARAVEILSSR